MLISPDLFLDCILYLINDNTERPRNLVHDLILLFENDVKVNTTIDNDVTRFYIRIIKSIMDAKVSKANLDELRLILLKFQSDKLLSTRGEIYQLLHDTFLSPEHLPAEKLEQLAGRLHNTLLWHKCNKITRTMFASLNRAADMVNPLDQDSELKKIMAHATTINTAFSETTAGPTRSLVEHVDMTDKDSMKRALTKHKNLAVTGVLRLGLQGLNRMCGERGGLARGESLVVYALPHNYKSGLLMSIATWVPLYNPPPQTAVLSGKKPLVLLISLENEAYHNFVWMFRHQYENQTQSSSKNLSDDEITDWAYTAFSTNGYTVVIERHMPYQFNFQTYVATIERYENSGYEVVLTSLDYANLMEKDGTGSRSEGGHHLAVKQLFSALCNYNKNKGITIVTAHPLNRKAAELRASNLTNVVKRFDSSHLADSFDVAREVDLEWYAHIEKNMDGVFYLTLKRGKHRYVDNTPEAHQYCAYPFHHDGIRDDLRHQAAFTTDIYADIPPADAERISPNQPHETVEDAVVF